MATNGTTSGSGERRTTERYARRITAYLLFPGHPPFAVRTADLSTLGVSVIAPVNLPAHPACAIQFDVSTESIGTEVRATVTHSVYSGSDDGFRVGFRFSSMTPELTNNIQKLLSA